MVCEDAALARDHCRLLPSLFTYNHIHVGKEIYVYVCYYIYHNMYYTIYVYLCVQ